jgi:hypothetical protein
MQIKLHTIAPFLVLALLIVGTIANGVISIASANSQTDKEPQLVDSSSEAASVHVSPEGVSGISVGQAFNVTVFVTGLQGNNLYGFDILFSWDTAALQYVSHEAKTPVEAHPEGILAEPVKEIKDEVDTTAGVYWLVCASMLPAEPCNKDGIIFVITFVLREPTENPYTVTHVMLANKNGDPISTQVMTPIDLPSFPPTSDRAEAQHRLGMWLWLRWWVRVVSQHG